MNANNEHSANILVGVDVGGTFTDVFILNATTGVASVNKVPTSKPDQSLGFLEGIQGTVADLTQVDVVVHGTTAGTNALLERKGKKTGVITTQGLRDVLEMRRRDRPRTWGLRGSFNPIVERENRLEVNERTLADGSIRTPVDLSAVHEATLALQQSGCEAVAILFANAYANAENELKAAKVVRALWHNTHVSTSSEILPEIREFERFSTTALNAYLQPEVSGYIHRLETALHQSGFNKDFLIVQSNGGVMSTDSACKYPIKTALSGPAAGVIAAGYIAKTAGFVNIITGDMGGTSFDVSLIANGQSMLSTQTSIDFGLVVRNPMVEMSTIGAGGGSIAWVDKGGLLNIGPESAGSYPGPVAYGLGNHRPTVTDANIVLGRIDSNNPIGGKLEKLDVNAAREAIEQHVGNPLNLSVEGAAEAILRVANSKMAGAIRLVSIERGFDPKQFVYMPFGGGGALHACALLNDVGLSKALIPRYPGVTSAMGCVIADMRYDFVQTLNTLLSNLCESTLSHYIQQHVNDGLSLLKQGQAAYVNQSIAVEMDMAYAGQTHPVVVKLPVELIDNRAQPISVESIGEAFNREYHRQFNRLLTNGVRRVISLRTSVIGQRPKFDLRNLAPKPSGDFENNRVLPIDIRDVYFAGKKHKTSVYDRLKLPVGFCIDGPAILIQADTTVLLEPHFQASVDAYGNTLIERHA